MIEILVYIRFGLLWLIPVTILITIYLGIKKLSDEKYRNKAIISLISIFALPVFIMVYNNILASVILNDIKQNVERASLVNSSITINNDQTNLNIKDVDNVLANLNFFHMRNHTHNLERYKITIQSNANNYSFSFYRDSGDNSLFWLYSDEYDYELELRNVNTNIFKK